MNTLKQKRIELGISQKELARKAGIDARTLRKIEAGGRVSDVSLNSVERVLGVSGEIVSVPTPAVARRRWISPFSIAGAFAYFGMCGLGWLSYTPDNNYWQAYPLAATLTATVVAFFYAMVSGPQRGNTKIEVRFPLSKAEEMSDPLSRVRDWLGRDDVMVSDVYFDGTTFRFYAYAEYQLGQIPSLIAKLGGFGLDTTVTSDRQF